MNYEHIPAELLAHQMLGVATCKAAGPLIENALREGWPLDAETITCPVRVLWGTDNRLLPWPSAAERFRDEWLLPQRRLFELLENNESALHAMAHDSTNSNAHLAMHERLDAILSDKAMPLAERVRVAAGIGVASALLGFLGKAFSEIPINELEPVIVDVINDVLRVK